MLMIPVLCVGCAVARNNICASQRPTISQHPLTPRLTSPYINTAKKHLNHTNSIQTPNTPQPTPNSAQPHTHATTTIVTHPKSSLKHPNRSPAHHFHPPSHYIYISTATISKRKLVLSIATGLRKISRAYMYLSTLVQSLTQLFKRGLDSGS